MVAVVAVAGVVASVVVDGARSASGELATDPAPPAWPHEVVDNGG